jgi:antitoxin component YwqK of YwqJK toxin-antitoxin module
MLNGKKHGKYEAYYRSGSLFETGYYCEDKAVGLWTMDSEEGVREMELFIKAEGKGPWFSRRIESNGEYSSSSLRTKRGFKKRLKVYQRELKEGKAPCFSI